MRITLLDKNNKIIQIVTPYMLRKLSNRFNTAVHDRSGDITVIRLTEASSEEVKEAIKEIEND